MDINKIDGGKNDGINAAVVESRCCCRYVSKGVLSSVKDINAQESVSSLRQAVGH